MKLETLATLTHINVRKEGKDEKVLAIDLRLSARVPSDVLIEFHPTLRSMLWIDDGNPRFHRLIESINLKGELGDHFVKINDVSLTSCSLRKFKGEAMPMHLAGIEFTVTFQPDNGRDLAILSEFVSDDVVATIVPEADLLDVLSRHADAGAERAETKVRTLDEWPFPVDKTAQPADQVKPRRKGKKAQQEASAP